MLAMLTPGVSNLQTTGSLSLPFDNELYYGKINQIALPSSLQDACLSTCGDSRGAS